MRANGLQHMKMSIQEGNVNRSGSFVVVRKKGDPWVLQKSRDDWEGPQLCCLKKWGTSLPIGKVGVHSLVPQEDLDHFKMSLLRCDEEALW